MKSHKETVLSILESGIANIQQNEEKINNLNVFPVPDGDTGSNMTGTLVNAWNNINENSESDIEILNDFARGALLGARGNSGVISSQLIKGLAEGVKKVGRFSTSIKDLKIILKSIRDYGYKAVSKPVEGTILSIATAMEQEFKKEQTDFVSAIRSLRDIAKKAVDNTPNQLKVLKESGVVDSGAFGVLMFLEGVLRAAEGKPLTIKAKGPTSHVAKQRVNQVTFKANPNKNIGYCTEFILTLKNPAKFSYSKLKTQLKKFGDSLVMIQEEDILKVHVHVKEPGEVFNIAQKYGEFTKIKADNMALQAEEAGHIVSLTGKVKYQTKKDDLLINDQLAIIAVSDGIGLDKEFSDLGVDAVISGGQSYNPSVQDFISQINNLNYRNILLLPNNSNIILTTDAVRNNIEDKNIYVLPTKTIQQGIFALYNINKDNMVDFNKHQASLTAKIHALKEISITKAIRDTKRNKIDVKKDEFIAVNGKKIFYAENDLFKVLEKVLKDLIDENIEVVTIFYNDEISNQELKIMEKTIFKKFKDVEFELSYGGQEIYHLLLFME
ncbi:MAG: phosphatase [Candidatus Hepatoplasma scabrum]|nr:MAG: phosphatase [Candidatus Hepatoplasma sp.]